MESSLVSDGTVTCLAQQTRRKYHRELPLGLVLVLVKIRRRVSEPNVRLGNRALYSCSRTGSNLVRIVLVSCTGVRWKDGMPRHLVFEKRIELRCYLRVSRLK